MRTLAKWLYALNRLRWYVTRPITIGVRLILEKDGSILLVRHTYQQQWYLPGGGIKKGETIEQAARREAHEEVGASLGQLHLLGIYSNFGEYKNDHIVVLSCRDFVLTGITDYEIERFALFPADDLPDSISPGTKRRIQEYVSGSDQPIVGMW